MTKHSNRDHSYSNHHKLHMPLCLLSNVIKDRVTVPGSFLFRISYMNTMFWSNLCDIPYPTASSLSLIKIFLPNFMCSFFKLNSSSVHGCRIIYSSMGSLSVATSLRKLTFPPQKPLFAVSTFSCVCVCDLLRGGYERLSYPFWEFSWIDHVRVIYTCIQSQLLFVSVYNNSVIFRK